MSGIIMMFILLLFFAAALIAAYAMITVASRAVREHMPLKHESFRAERLIAGSIRSKN